jgi:putative tryptophan/tyrosine transport system substrate-binding protein
MVRRSRRQFLLRSLSLASCALLSGCGASPVPWQQQAKMPRVGLLLPGAEAGSTANVAAFKDGLRDLGHVDGQNIVVEVRFAEGRADRLSERAGTAASGRVGRQRHPGHPGGQPGD